jgi:uncharacterized RDD family membrane protein YckC
VSDYYDLLGVDPGADKEAIKAAYRDQLDGASQAERAKLNKAWNVLSDPVQRERYDDARSAGWLDDADDEEEEETAPARRGGVRGGGRTPTPARTRQPARPLPEPTVELPPGMDLADTRSRGLALLIDFSILFVILILTQFVIAPAIIKSQFPERSKRIDQLNDANKKIDKQKSKADDRADNSKLSKAQRDAAKKESKRLDDQITKNNDKVTDIAKAFTGTTYLVLGAMLAVFLAILVPSTALTGQTLGMKLRKVRVVRADGAPVGWGPALIRFAVPLLIALALPTLGFIIGLGMVLWYLRDRNRQGFHDKLARTLVVAA